MPLNLQAAQRFFGNITDKIMIIAGGILVVMAVAFFTPAYQLLPMVFLLSGVLLTVVGVVLHFESESFKLKIPSLEGWGTISICASALLMAAAVGFAFYAVVGRTYLMPRFWSESAVYHAPKSYITLVSLVRPNLWLTTILAFGAITLLIIGIFLKFYRDIF